MRIRHIVSTRFFGSHVTDMNEISTLLNSFISTLKNSSNKNFECVILTNESDISILKNIKFPIDVSITTTKNLIEDIKSNILNYDYIIHTNCDYDDFFHKNNISIIQKSINFNTTFKIHGFTNGVTLVRGEKTAYIFKKDYLGIDGFFSCCSSIIYSTKLNFTNEFPYLIHDVAKKYGGNHPKWKHIIEAEYKNWGLLELDNDFFDSFDDGIPRWIWIRQPSSITTKKIIEENKNMHLSEIQVILNFKDYGYEY